MKSFGSFFGLTASSLMLCSWDELANLNALTTRHQDEYAAEELLEELNYLRTFYFDKQELVQEKVLENDAVKQRVNRAVLNGVKAIIEKRIELKKVAGNSTSDDFDMFGDGAEEASDDFDMFGNDSEEASDDFDMFGSDSVESTNNSGKQRDPEMQYLINRLAVNFSEVNINTLYIIGKSEEAFDNAYTSSTLHRLQDELDSANSRLMGYFKPNADTSMLDCIEENDVPYRSLLENGRSLIAKAYADYDVVSIFHLSYTELSLLKVILQDKITFDILQVSDNPLITDTRYALILAIGDKAKEEHTIAVANSEEIKESKIEYCIRLFKSKATNVTGAKEVIFNIPVNRLQLEFSNFRVCDNAKRILTDVDKDSSPQQRIDTLTILINKIDQAILFIQGLGADEFASTSKDAIALGQNGLWNALNGDNAYEEYKEFIDYLRSYRKLEGFNPKEYEAIAYGGKNGEKLERQANGIKQNLYKGYKLRQLNTAFSLETLNNAINDFSEKYNLGIEKSPIKSMQDLIDVNEYLGVEFQYLPFTNSKLFMDVLAQNFELDDSYDPTNYKEVIPNLELIKRHLLSARKMEEITANVTKGVNNAV